MKKEKLKKQMVLMVPPSLFAKFSDTCKQNYKTVSIVVREMMLEYVKKNEK